MLAAKHGHAKCVTVLLERNADVEVRTERGYNCLMESIAEGHEWVDPSLKPRVPYMDTCNYLVMTFEPCFEGHYLHARTEGSPYGEGANNLLFVPIYTVHCRCTWYMYISASYCLAHVIGYVLRPSITCVSMAEMWLLQFYHIRTHGRNPWEYLSRSTVTLLPRWGCSLNTCQVWWSIFMLA